MHANRGDRDMRHMRRVRHSRGKADFDAKTAERKSKTYAFGVAGDEPEPTEKERKGSKGIQKQRRGPNVKKSRDDERFLKRMRGGR